MPFSDCPICSLEMLHLLWDKRLGARRLFLNLHCKFEAVENCIIFQYQAEFHCCRVRYFIFISHSCYKIALFFQVEQFFREDLLKAHSCSENIFH